ncbi:MAG: VanZ family protein [Tannerella sp.]|jgi:VanZ family protein|nr:VanZ family protein [Tannerella sp.]
MVFGKKTYLLLFLSIVWAAVIFYLCTMPTNQIPKFEFRLMDKLAHFGIFFILSVLLSLLFNFQTRKSYFVIILLSMLIMAVYGGLIEILQDRFFNRQGDFYDFIADMAGGFVGALFFPTFIRLFNFLFKSKK